VKDKDALKISDRFAFYFSQNRVSMFENMVLRKIVFENNLKHLLIGNYSNSKF